MLRGTPYIYQGEELGYWGTKSNGDEYVRTPILWDKAGNELASGSLSGKIDMQMLTAAISVEAQEQVYGVPYLLTGLHIIRKETTGGAISGFIKMRCQHDHRLFRGGWHRIFRVVALRDVLVAFRIGNSGGDVALQKFIIRRMLQNEIGFYF